MDMHEISDSESKASKLPVRKTVKETYRLAWEKRGQYLRLSRWWLILTVPLVFIYNWLTFPLTGQWLCPALYEAPKGSAPDATASEMAGYLLLIPSSVYLMLAGASIAVAWHRHILRGERIEAGRYLRLDTNVRNYLAVGFCLYFPFFLIELLGFLGGFDFAIATKAIWRLLPLSMFAVAIWVITRISVILPAVALSEGVTAREVWRKTRANFWPLFEVFLFCTLPVAIGLAVIIPDCMGKLSSIALDVFNTVAYLAVVLPLELTFLSLSYRHFFPQKV